MVPVSGSNHSANEEKCLLPNRCLLSGPSRGTSCASTLSICFLCSCPFHLHIQPIHCSILHYSTLLCLAGFRGFCKAVYVVMYTLRLQPSLLFQREDETELFVYMCIFVRVCLCVLWCVCCWRLRTKKRC